MSGVAQIRGMARRGRQRRAADRAKFSFWSSMAELCAPRAALARARA